MKLLLSSDTLPQADFDVLSQACHRRAFAGLELVLREGQDHGIDAELCPIRQNTGISCVPEVVRAPVVWLVLPETASLTTLMIWAGEVHLLQAGLLLTRPVPELPIATRVALIHGTSIEEAREAAAWAEQHNAFTCWQVDPDRRDPALWKAVLDITGPHLAHVRLPGSGPEAQGAAPSTPGTGTLLSLLALRGYFGTIALTPSSSEYLEDWEQWLLTGRGWGCGTAYEKKMKAQVRATGS